MAERLSHSNCERRVVGSKLPSENRNRRRVKESGMGERRRVEEKKGKKNNGNWRRKIYYNQSWLNKACKKFPLLLQLPLFLYLPGSSSFSDSDSLKVVSNPQLFDHSLSDLTTRPSLPPTGEVWSWYHFWMRVKESKFLPYKESNYDLYFLISWLSPLGHATLLGRIGIA